MSGLHSWRWPPPMANEFRKGQTLGRKDCRSKSTSSRQFEGYESTRGTIQATEGRWFVHRTSRPGSNSAQPATRIELEDVHTWMSPGGHSVESKMVDCYRDQQTNALQIVLTGRNGEQIAVPYEKLDEASQRLASRIIHARQQSRASSAE